MAPQPSPYADKPQTEWKAITKRLVEEHPLKLDVIRDVALAAWTNVWNTTVGSGTTSVSLSELNAPAMVIGYFFEILFARELAARFPTEWRGNLSGEEKDVVYIPELGSPSGHELSRSIEIKSSGQLGYKIFGNRSTGQEVKNPDQVKKEKSGYYITMNFYGRTLTLLRCT